MDDIKSNQLETGGLPQKTFMQLISELRKSDLPVPIIDQLEKEIVTAGNLTEAAIRSALLGKIEQ